MSTDRRLSTHSILVVAGIGAAAFLVWHLAEGLLVIFAGILLAVFLDGLAGMLASRTSLPRALSLLLVVLLLIALIGGVGYIEGGRIGQQMAQLFQRIPQALEQIVRKVQETPLGQSLFQTGSPGELSRLSLNLIDRIRAFFSTAFGAFINGVVIFFVGLYGAAQPGVYVGGFLRMVVPDRRERWRAIVAAIGHALRWWLVGRVTTMALIGLLTTIGLLIIHMPLAVGLGIIAGLLTFVPYLGAIASSVPAILISFAKSPETAIYVIGLYLLVHAVEGYLLTPLIQRRTVSVAPALLISAQLLSGILFGIWGLALATPLLVAIIVMIQMLYIQDLLGERITLMGPHERK